MVPRNATELADGEVKVRFIITKPYVDLTHPVRMCKRLGVRKEQGVLIEEREIGGNESHWPSTPFLWYVARVRDAVPTIGWTSRRET
jgi:hypothetical protein